jgi:tRNA1Val (adenine37-N6)-methyltransferase
MIQLLENERLDEVNDRLRLIQKTDGLTFGTDALLLAGYVRGFQRARALELGGGTGIVSLLLAGRHKTGEILTVELMEAYADLIRRNIALNHLEDTVKVAHTDLRDTASYGGDGCDFIVTNPPYMKADSGYLSPSDSKNTARHELFGTISDFIAAAAKKLRFGGHFYCVYRPDRLPDLLCSMRSLGIEPKRLTTVAATCHAVPSMVLVDGILGGAPGMRMTRPLILYTDAPGGAYSDDMNQILEAGCFPKDFG